MGETPPRRMAQSPCLRGVDGNKRLILRIQIDTDATTCLSVDPDTTSAALIETLQDKGQGESDWVLTTGSIESGSMRMVRSDEVMGEIANKECYLNFSPVPPELEDEGAAPEDAFSPRSTSRKSERGVVKGGGKCKYGPSKLKGTYHKDPSTYTELNETVMREFPALGERSFSRPIGGFESQHGMMPDDDNKRAEGKQNQDRGCYKYPYCGDDKCAFFGCFDGHGAEGHNVSEFVVANLPFILEGYLRNGMGPEEALKKAYIETERKLKLRTDIDSDTSGCTCVSVLLLDKHMFVANVGDSRACVGEEGGEEGRLLAIELTQDQKPNSPGERVRIRQMGGYVSPETANESARVFVEKDGEGGLALARAIGDCTVGAVGVIAEPVVTQYHLQKEDKCLILASDGVWEYIECQEAVEIATQNASASRAATALKEESMERWKKHGLYRDDITCGVLYLPLW